MASELRVTTIANNAGTESVDTTYVINGSAKAWVNFNGTGTVAIRDSVNVASLTDGGTGTYSYTVSNSCANTNFSCQGTSHAVGLAWMFSPQTFADSTSVARFYVVTSSGGSGDASQCDGTINGDLA